MGQPVAMPDFGPSSGKVWGTTQLGFRLNGCESHFLSIAKGGYCSKHIHKSKWNRFHVLTGKLNVDIYQDDNHIDSTILTPGQFTDVPPGCRHCFHALEDSIVMEYYWTLLDPEDIERYGTTGGRNSHDI